MGPIIFWVVILLLIISAFAPSDWKWGPYAWRILELIALVLLGVHVFGFKL